MTKHQPNFHKRIDPLIKNLSNRSNRWRFEINHKLINKETKTFVSTCNIFPFFSLCPPYSFTQVMICFCFFFCETTWLPPETDLRDPPSIFFFMEMFKKACPNSSPFSFNSDKSGSSNYDLKHNLSLGLDVHSKVGRWKHWSHDHDDRWQEAGAVHSLWNMKKVDQ